MSALATALVALSFALSAAAQRTTRSRGSRIARGAIAGIVIGALPSTSLSATSSYVVLSAGCVAFLLLICLCCLLCIRRRRARNSMIAPTVTGGGRFGGAGPGVQEAGYASGPHPNNAGWNTDAQPAYGGQQYQPPQGAPLSAPQPGGFAPVSLWSSTSLLLSHADNPCQPPGAPPAAHTRPY